MRRSVRRAVALVIAGGLLTAATACSDKPGSPTATPRPLKELLVFGVGGDAKVLDPAIAIDSESFRVTRQLFEGLVQLEPGGTKLEPALAESWQPDASGRVWTFTLKQGVKFHDGTDLTGEAVCANFNRWFTWSGRLQLADFSIYWQEIFGGFARNERPGRPNLFTGCQAPDGRTAVITLTRPSSKFPAALVLPAFAISSPKALAAHKADRVNVTGGKAVYPAYGLEHPTGTGPYRFVKWDRKDHVIEIERFEDYHGTKAKVKTIRFKTILDAATRKQALLDGEIHGYDLVTAGDLQPLRDEGFSVLTRPPFHVFYLGFNQSGHAALRRAEVRQAIAYAVNKQAIVDKLYPAGASVAVNFCPPNLAGCDAEVQAHTYDPAKARQLLTSLAGQVDLTLRFTYPSEVTRPYMPQPKEIYEMIAADLKAVGFTITPIELKWSPDYLQAVQYGTAHDLHLLSWFGDYPDAYTFLGNMFERRKSEWGFTNEQLFGQVKAADALIDPAARAQAYRMLGVQLSQLTPGVPLVHDSTSLVFAKGVTGLAASPLFDERFETIDYR